LDLVLAQRTRYTLVLAGDHIYKMDYRPLIEQHVQSGADVTLGCVPVCPQEAGSFGVLGVDTQQRVRSFIEKPPPESLPASTQRNVLASMGVYVFTTEYLAERLRQDASNADSAHDFGRNILPVAVREDRVGAYAFSDARGAPGYWRDVGTLDAYWQAHMELLVAAPPIDLFDPNWPIFTLAEPLPPARVMVDSAHEGCVANSLLGGGVIVRGARIRNSVLSANVQVGAGSSVEEAVILPGVRIGSNCRLHRVIVDSGMHIPDGTIVGHPGEQAQDERRVRLLVPQLVGDRGADALRSVA
ncbi:MAG TPA: sugar phosphate nucleotidyltransferase, partial [Steroidobacteraceae bacterium]|nr:sugar phosphate nucleotidyltransferase [Steroidobacteraceae bacterium]